MQMLAGLIDIDAIAALPWQVGLPGVLLVVLLVWRALKSLLALRPFKAVSSFIMAFAVAVILSKGGQSIAALIAPPS